MASEMRVGVVGLGMGMHHCKALEQAKGAALGAVCDTDPERLENAVNQYGCKGYKSYAAMLKDADIDIISIATESGKHAKMGVQAVEAGKHIVVEKPLDITVENMTMLTKAVRKTGKKCACIFQSRLENSVRMIKEAIDKGKMGRVFGVHAGLPWFRAQSYYEGPHGKWKGTWRMDGGGSLMNQGIHTVDMMCHLAGPVRSVFGYYGIFDHDIQAEDHTVAVLRFENGALGTLYSTTACTPEGAQRVFMFGEKGSFSRHGGRLESYDLDTPAKRKRMLELFGSDATTDEGSRDPMAVSADGHMVIFEDLVKAIADDREPVIPLESAMHSVSVACDIYRSGKTRKEVDLRKMKP